MNTKDFVIYHNGKGQEVKQVGKVLPNVGSSIILQTLVVEAINLSDLTGLVVSPQDVNATGVAHLGG